MVDAEEELIFADLHAADLMLPAKRPYDEVVKAYQDIENRYAPSLDAANDPRATLLRRRVADSIMMAAMAYDRPIAECEALLQRKIALGFDDLYHKAMAMFGFAGYCHHEHGQGHVGLPYLEAVIDELEAAVVSGTAEKKDTRILADVKKLRAQILKKTKGRKGH